MPVGGGAIATVVPVSGGVIFAVDDANVYYLGEPMGLYRSPKTGGGSQTLLSEPGVSPSRVTVQAGRAYWYEQSAPDGSLAVKSTSLDGGPITTVATITALGPGAGGGLALGVTSTTGFLAGMAGSVGSFPLDTGAPGGQLTTVSAVEGCELLVSDSDAVYCMNGDIVRIASDGTTTALATMLPESGIPLVVYDESYVYWAQGASDGTIMREPKTGAGTPAVIARDSQPGAMAVDANAVYWADQGGNIMRLPK